MTSRNRLEKSARQRADFTPALGRAPSTLYDLAIRLFTREKCWRRIVLRTLAPQPGERILDVGCGTGTLAIAIKSIEPMAKITGIDPDPETLVRAIAKEPRSAAPIFWTKGFARDAAAGRRGAFDAVTCTLVLHQVPLEEKRAGLGAMFDALAPGGRLILADYGEQRSSFMRMLFRQTVQRLDGTTDTQPNADGVLPRLLQEAGFEEVTETAVVPTLTGLIAVFKARKPMTLISPSIVWP